MSFDFPTQSFAHIDTRRKDPAFEQLFRLNTFENNMAYLVVNQDVANAFVGSRVPSGFDHWMTSGRDEGRAFPPAMESYRAALRQIDGQLMRQLESLIGIPRPQEPPMHRQPNEGPLVDVSRIKPAPDFAPTGHVPPKIDPAPYIEPLKIEAAPDITPLHAPAAIGDPEAIFERNVQAHSAAGVDMHRAAYEREIPEEALERLPAYSPQFNAGQYLAENPDVDNAVKQGLMPSAAHHYYVHGFEEGRNGYVN